MSQHSHTGTEPAKARATGDLNAIDQVPYQQRYRLLMSAFNGTISPVKTSLAYRLAILAVSCVMLLLPLIYIGIIAVVGYGIYWHAIHNVSILGSVRGRGVFLALMAYVAPMVAGGFLFIFMLKPIFAGTGRRAKTRKLTEQEEPLLFAFVRRVCDTVQAPYPKSIEVDCQVNASASFRRGAWSMLGNDLRLTIGTPLVAGLNMRQFAGVLAHEFGHFSQGAGMRLTYVIRTISFWLTRAVYERDQWDEWLVGLSQSIDIRIGWIFYLTRLFVWITRGVLWCLMLIGNTVSGYLLRQMEFDADRYETRLAGNQTFESTARRLAALNVANQGAQNDLASFYREGRLGNDLARLITANVQRLDKPLLKKINDMVDSQTTGIFDTHPCDTERIASANAEPTHGIFRIASPAAALFRNFPVLSKIATLNYFREIFGTYFSAEKLHDIDDLLIRQNVETNSYDAADRFYQANFLLNRMSKIQVAQAMELAETKKLILNGRTKLNQSLADTKQSLDRYNQLAATENDIAVARSLLDDGFKVGKTTFSIPLTSRHEINQAQQRAAGERLDLEHRLAPVEKLNQQRLAVSLSLLRNAKVANKVKNFDDVMKDAQTMIAVFNQLIDTIANRIQLEKETHFASILWNHFQDTQPEEAQVLSLKKALKSIRHHAIEIRNGFRSVDYPFDHANQGMSIARFLCKDPPGPEEYGEIIELASSLATELPRLQCRALGRLCEIAERLESMLGIPKLPSINDDHEQRE